MDNTQFAISIFDAFTRGDAAAARALCAPDFQVRQNGGAAMNLEAVLGFTAAVLKVVKGFRYEDAVRSATATGFVEEHAVRGTLPDGRSLDLAVCVVAIVKGGKITDVREYFDSKAAEGLVKALS
jgi:ketosteroid isomerase-like protein